VSEGNSWGWGSARVAGLVTIGIAVLVLWTRFELRAPDPLVDMKMMRLRGVWTANLTALLVGFGMFGAFLLLPQLVQLPVSSGYGFGASVTAAGLFLLPSSAAMLFAGPLAGVLANRVGGRVPLLLGVAIACVSFVLFAFAHGERWEIYIASALNGMGIGLSFAAMATLVVDAVPQAQTGIATGMNTIMRSIGGALGAQIAASIVSAHVGTDGIPAESGYTAAFVVSAIALVLAFLAGLLIPRRRVEAVVPHGQHRLGEPLRATG
jgi:MFS family permease